MTKKGQYFSLDAIVASLIFIITIMTLLSYWYSVKSSIEKQDSEVLKEAFRISDLLFTSQIGDSDCKIGFADNWNYKTLNYTAIKNCEGMTREGINGKLGTGYDTVIVFNIDETSAIESITLGEAPSKIKDVAKVQRVAAIMIENYEGGKVKTFTGTVDVYLYN